MGDGLFATALMGMFDARSRRLDVVSAGHPPPLLRGPEVRFRECKLVAALPLGVQTAPELSLFQINLSRVAAIVMFTDGLVEWNSQHRSQLPFV